MPAWRGVLRCPLAQSLRLGYGCDRQVKDLVLTARGAAVGLPRSLPTLTSASLRLTRPCGTTDPTSHWTNGKCDTCTAVHRVIRP